MLSSLSTFCPPLGRKELRIPKRGHFNFAQRGLYYFALTPFSIIAVSEGAQARDGEQVFRIMGDHLVAARLGGLCQNVAEELSQQTHLETRFTILGHLQRGGQPSPYDRWLATRYGAAAVRLAAANQFGYMVNIRGREIGEILIKDALDETPKLVNPDGEQVQTARALGSVFGDES